MKITVVGSGGWGTALALLLVENGHDVTLWSHTPAKAVALEETRENPMLKGVPLPPEMKFTADLGAVKDCGAVVMATPSYAVRETAHKLRGIIDPGTVVISVSKGIEKDSSLRLSQVIEEELEGKCPVVVLSGPLPRRGSGTAHSHRRGGRGGQFEGRGAGPGPVYESPFPGIHQ